MCRCVLDQGLKFRESLRGRRARGDRPERSQEISCKKGKGHQNKAPSLLEPRVFSRVFRASIRPPLEPRLEPLRASIRAF